MFGKSFNRSTGPIGCAFSENEVRLTQLCTARSGQTALTASSRPLIAKASDRAAWREAAAQAVRDALAGDVFVGRRIVTCLPDGQVAFRRLRLPTMPDSDLSSAVHWQTAKELSRPAKELRTAYYEIGEGRGTSKRHLEVLAVIAGMADVESHAAMLCKIGLTPTAIDTKAGALARCVCESDGDPQSSAPKLVIDADTSSTTLIAVRDGQPYFIHSLPTGFQQVVERTAHQLGVCLDEPEALWKFLDGADGTAPSAASLPAGMSGSKVVQTLRAACDLYIQELAHEVVLCVHYLSELETSEPQVRQGCVVGGGVLNNLIVQTLCEASDIEFCLWNDMWSPRFLDLTEKLDAGQRLDAWWTSLGLAFYGVEHELRRAVA